MRTKRIIAMIMAIAFMLASLNMTAIAAGEPAITMGAATYSDADHAMYFSNLTVSGDSIRTIMISFSKNVTSGDQMILPAMSESFTLSPTSNNYVARINVNEGTPASHIQALLRGMGFRVAGQTQTVNITVTSDLITTDTFYNQSTGHYYQFIPSTSASWTNAYLHAKSLSYMGRTGYLATVTSKEEDVFLNTLSGGKTGWLGGTILENSGMKVDASDGIEGNLLYYSAMNEQAVVSTGWYWACGPEIGNTFFTVNSLRASTGETAGAQDANHADAQNPSTYYNWARGTSSYEPNNVTYDLSYLSPDYEACLTTLTVAGNMGKQGTSFSWNDKNYGMTGTGVWYPKGYFVEYGNQTIGDVGSSSAAYASDSGSLSGIPALTGGMVRRISNTEATIHFSTDRGGSYYYAIVEDGAGQPVIDTTDTGVPCLKGAQTLTNPVGLTEGAKDIYIQVKDGMGKLSVPLKLDLNPANSVQLTNLHWLTPTSYHCDLELSSSAKMITVSVNNGYFTIPSLGSGINFMGGTKGSTYLNTYSSSTQQFDSVIFSFADADAAESILSSIIYVTQGDTPQSIHASTSTILPMGDDIFFNGHFYRYVSGSIDWMSAALAAGGTVDPYFEGRGYLATATNQSENSILLKLTDNGGYGADHWNDAWLGGLWQRNLGTVETPSIDRGTDGHEITFQDLLGATNTQRHNMLIDYSERFGNNAGNIYNMPDTVKYYWLDGPEAGQEIAYNTPTFSPWHVGEPNGGDFIYIGWEGAYWDDLSADVSSYDHVYSTLSGYVVEFSGYDGGSDAGIIKETTKTVTADITAPVLTAGASDRTSHTEGSFHFGASEAGKFYYTIVEHDDSAPTIDTSGDGTTCIAGGNFIENPVGLTKGAKDLYIQMKDSVGNLSNVIKFEIEHFNTAPSFLSAPAYLMVASDSTNNDLVPYMHVSDPDENQLLTFSIAILPAHGTVNCQNTTLYTGGSDIAPGGSMIYTPEPGFCGVDTFSLLVTDGDGYSYLPFHVTVVDQTKPTLTITQGTNQWNSFLNTITFGLFFKNTIDISLTAQDQGGSGLKNVQYYLSSTSLSLEELQDVTDWNTYTSAFQITPVDKQKHIIYAKATDNAGNITVVSSDGMEFDLQKPVITNNYQKGASSMEVTVSDEGSKVDTVVYSINHGSDIPAVLVNGKFSISSLADGKYDVTITATDKAGNSSTETIPVVSLHTVEFYRYDGDPSGPVKTQIVEYGDAATAPTNMERAGFSFTGWDETFSNITTDLVVNGTWEIDGITVLPYTGIYDGLSHLCASVTGTLPVDLIRYSTNGTDYSSTCPTITNYGTYPIYVSVERTGTAPWVGTLKQAVIQKKDLASSMIEVPASYKYTGQPVKPVPVLTDGLKTLQEDTDYTVAYSNNTEIGIATISVTGIGNYKNTATKSFAIYSNNTSVNIVDEKTPQVLVTGLDKLYDDNQIYTSNDREVEENGGSVNIELSVQTKTSTGSDQGKITQMATGKEIGLFLDISLMKTVKLAGESNGTTSPIKHTNQLLSIVIPIPNDLKNKEGITLYRVHEGVPSVIPVGAANAIDGEYCTIDSQNITLYVQNFSTYAIGYNQSQTIPKSPQTGEESSQLPWIVLGLGLAAVVVHKKSKRKLILNK